MSKRVRAFALGHSWVSYMGHVVLVIMFLFAVTQPLPCSAGDVTNAGPRKLVEKTTPEYPSLAKKNGLTGAVKLHVTVAPDGHVKEVQVVGGNPVFIASATDSVKKWKWSSVDHETVETVELNFDFH